MLISSGFNRFMHGVVLKFIAHNVGVLKFYDAGVKFYPRYFELDTVKQILKALDLNYPRNRDFSPFSYTKLSAFDMLMHVKWVEVILSENGYFAPWLDDEFYKKLKEENNE